MDEAESLAREALETRVAHFGEDSPHIGRSLDTLASILVEKNECVEAEELAHKAVELKRTALGPGHPEVAKSLIGKSLYWETTQDGCSIFLLRAPMVTALFWCPGLGIALLEGSKTGAAQSKIARAQDICTAQLGSKHPLTEQAAGLLERCKQALASKKSMDSA